MADDVAWSDGSSLAEPDLATAFEVHPRGRGRHKASLLKLSDPGPGRLRRRRYLETATGRALKALAEIAQASGAKIRITAFVRTGKSATLHAAQRAAAPARARSAAAFFAAHGRQDIAEGLIRTARTRGRSRKP